jgi:uncharacterized membrane protein YsdA (DUF1294 family)
MNNTAILFALLGIWNVITFSLMGIDKRKAEKHRYRISEKSLFLCAFLFGGIGVLCGMYLFRHKTKHWSFKIFVPVAVIINITVFYYLLVFIKGI